MVKVLYLALILIMPTQLLYANVVKPTEGTLIGYTTIDSTVVWSEEGSPYILNNEQLVISEGGKLIIEPGVTVTTSTNFEISIVVHGTLLGLGTSGKNITIKNARIGIWKKTLSEDDPALFQPIFEHTDFIDSYISTRINNNVQDSLKINGDLSNGAITIKNSSFNNSVVESRSNIELPFNIIDCDILDTQINGTNNTGQRLNIIGSRVTNSRIGSDDGHSGGIWFKRSALENCEFLAGFGSSNLNFIDSHCNNSTIYYENSNVYIKRSDFNYTSIYSTYGRLQIEDSRLYDPKGTPWSHISAGKLVFKNSDFGLDSEMTDVKGIFSEKFDPRSDTIMNCRFQKYKNAIDIVGIDIPFSIFKNNYFIDIGEYNISWQSKHDLLAQYNYWGTTVENEIALKIFDGNDTDHMRFVDYSNFLTVPPRPTVMPIPKNAIKSKNGNTLSISWDAVDAPDLAGYKLYIKNKDDEDFTFLVDNGNSTTYSSEILSMDNEFVVTAYSTAADGTNDRVEGNESGFSECANEYFSFQLLSRASICSEDELEFELMENINFTKEGFVVQISDENKSFTNAIDLDTIDTQVSMPYRFSLKLPNNLVDDQGYLLRLLAIGPNINSEPIPISYYATPSSNFDLIQEQCEKDTVLITYNGQFMGNTTFEWSLDGGQVIENENDTLLRVIWSSLGEKLVTLSTTRNGCTSTTSRSTLIKKMPTALFEAQNTICENEVAIVTYTGNAAGPAIFNWDFGDAEILSGSGEGPYEITWNIDGKKHISLQAEEDGCPSYLQTDSIQVNPLPSSDFSMISENCGMDTVLVTYNAQFMENMILEWSLDGGQIIESKSDTLLKVFWPNTGEKQVLLTAIRNDCSSSTSKGIIIKQTPTAFFEAQNIICENEVATVTYTGNASDSAIFNWDFEDAEILSGTGLGPYVVTWETYGKKHIQLQVEEDGCNSELYSDSLTYSPYPVLSFENLNSICHNEIFDISYLGSNEGVMEWDFDSAEVIDYGSGSYGLKWVESGEKTITFSINNNGCFSDTSIKVNVTPLPTVPEICMVTVDMETSKNMLVWDHSSGSIERYGIYRETNVAEQYNLIDYVDASTLNTYIDEVSIPEQASSRYKISAVDSCGKETGLSDYHKTIHLTINKGIDKAWNLIWDGYEGLAFSTYRIYRGTKTDDMQLLTEIASSATSYTDIDAPSGKVNYQIEVVNPNTCGDADNGKIGSFNRIRSNIARFGEVTALGASIEGFSLYPNPTDNRLQVHFENVVSGSYSLITTGGKLILNGTVSKAFSIDMTDLPKGIYILRISTDKGTVTHKVSKG